MLRAFLILKCDSVGVSVSSLTPRIKIGFTSLTDQYSGNNVSTNKVSVSPTFTGADDTSTTVDCLNVAQCDGNYREVSIPTDITGLDDGDTYQVTIQMKAGSSNTASSANDKPLTMLAPLVTVQG